jgi:hypothetical protein
MVIYLYPPLIITFPDFFRIRIPLPMGLQGAISSTLKNGHDSAICAIPPSRKLTTFKKMDAHPVICAFGKIPIKKWE